MRITIDIPDDTARRIEEHIAGAKSNCNSHGPLTLQGLMNMLAEDVGLSVARPGSWEAPTCGLFSHPTDTRGKATAIAWCNAPPRRGPQNGRDGNGHRLPWCLFFVGDDVRRGIPYDAQKCGSSGVL
jgi:hypothetical protein